MYFRQLIIDMKLSYTFSAADSNSKYYGITMFFGDVPTCFNNILIPFHITNDFAVSVDSLQVLMTMWIVLLLLSVCSETVICYSNGKVEVACGDMTPQHGHDPSTKNPPFNIIADKSQFSPGDEIKGSNTVAVF